MGVLASIYLKEETLETLLKVVKAKKEKGVSLTVSISDKTDNYGQNVASFVAQSKEDREAKKPKYYTGNGKVFWTDGNVSVAEKVEAQPKQTASVEEDLPF